VHRIWTLALVASLLVGAPALAGPREEAQAKRKAGDKLLAEGDYEGALKAFEEGKALVADPEFDLARGQALVKLYRYEDAKAAFEAYLAAGSSTKHTKAVKKAITELEKILKTTLFCESEPPGATVYLDSRVDGAIGTAPSLLYLAPGAHRVIFELPGFLPKIELVDVPEGGKGSVKAVLVPAPMTLELTSEPSGAAIFVDGTEKGKTPSTLELSAGPHKIELKLKGYQDLPKTVEGKSSEKLSWAAKLLESPTELALELNPPRARASIQGKDGPVGEPAQAGIIPLPPGRYRLVATAKGYHEKSAEVVLNRGERVPAKLELEPFGGVISVKLNYPGAKVFIDGVEQPNLGEIELAEGKYTLKVIAPGQSLYEGPLEIKPGDSLTADVTLKKERQSQTRLLLTGAAGAGGLWLLSGGLAILTDAVLLKKPDAGEGTQTFGKVNARISDLSFVVGVGFAVWGGKRYLSEGASTATVSPAP
jgi:tetratricopeptide (TPR) repeat protein